MTTALEAILEEYEDGEFETLGELLDFYIDELKECPTDEADVGGAGQVPPLLGVGGVGQVPPPVSKGWDEHDALVRILVDWEEGKLPMARGGISDFEMKEPSTEEAERGKLTT